MPYNLTDKQKDVARAIVKAIREDELPETFSLHINSGELRAGRGQLGRSTWPKADQSTLKCLELNDLIVLGQGWTTVTGKLFTAVDNNFTDESNSIAGLKDLADDVMQFRVDHPD